MDNTYLTQALQIGLPGLALVLAPIPAFLMSRSTTRFSWIAVSAPGGLAATAFVAACLASSWTPRTNYEPYLMGYGGLLILSLALIIPAVLALKRRYLGFLYLCNVLGTALLYFVGGMAITHDWL